MRTLLLASFLLVSCGRVPGGLPPAPDGAGGAGAGGAADPCAGATFDAWGFCRGPDGQTLDAACCPSPEPRPCHERVLRGCELDGLCRWLVPGCAAPALPEAGCFPAADCVEGECAEGLSCRTVVIDPCQGRPCGAVCVGSAAVCLPPLCHGDEQLKGGACVAPDGSAVPPACCTWPCTPGGIFCTAEPPECPAGEVPAVAGGCWGPCIPPDRCLEGIQERRCRDTGGTWDLDCGHASCGITPSCVDPRPSCRCGALQTFDEELGCTDSDVCLCLHTGGIWDEQGCGHVDCGRPGSCDQIVAGCVCPLTHAFVAGSGCQESDTCRAREGESCGRDTDLPCAPGLACRGGICRR